MVHSHASRVRAMALARPRGELGHIRPKLPRAAHPRPLNGAPARAHYNVFLGPHCLASPRDGPGSKTRTPLMKPVPMDDPSNASPRKDHIRGTSQSRKAIRPTPLLAQGRFLT
ncbi:hypothetical protein PIB30_088082, partial [Stylosanthes scabra]|nr:hypothetical protein [Stylosanthes scabra]